MKRTKSKDECNDFKNAVTLTLSMHTKSHFQGATNMSSVEPVITTLYLSKKMTMM